MTSSRALYTLEKGDSYYEGQTNQTTVAPECKDHSVGTKYSISSIYALCPCCRT